MSKTRPIHVSADAYKAIKDYATKHAKTIGDAVDDLVTTAVKRKAALDKYRGAKKA